MMRYWMVLVAMACCGGLFGAEPERVRAYKNNPHYLAWGDQPIFPLGATDYHGWTPISRPGTMDYRHHLDRLAEVIREIGSPHVWGLARCLPYDPMNHLHDGPVSRVLQPWVRMPDGRFDLTRFAPEWEERLRDFLGAALSRRIIVSLEIWDDWSITRGPGGQYNPADGGGWNAHPFNPSNNVNYGEEVLPARTAVCEAPFYSTIPARRNIEPVLKLQKHYVDHLLEIAGAFPNVIFSIANETRAHLDWSRFWAAYVGGRLPAGALVGEMPSTNRRDGGGECDPALNPLTLATDPRYGYVDVAQGVSSHEFRSPRDQALGGGQRIFEYRRAMAEAGTRKPLVVSKDYTRGPEGGTMVLWSRFVGGAATARFHRPAKDHPPEVSAFQHATVRRLGEFIAQVPFWKMEPNPGMIESLPEGAGANVLAEAEGQGVLQIVGGSAGGEVVLQGLPDRRWEVRWIDAEDGRVIESASERSRGGRLELSLTGEGEHRIVHVRPAADERGLATDGGGSY